MNQYPRLYHRSQASLSGGRLPPQRSRRPQSLPTPPEPTLKPPAAPQREPYSIRPLTLRSCPTHGPTPTSPHSRVPIQTATLHSGRVPHQSIAHYLFATVTNGAPTTLIPEQCSRLWGGQGSLCSRSTLRLHNASVDQAIQRCSTPSLAKTSREDFRIRTPSLFRDWSRPRHVDGLTRRSSGRVLRHQQTPPAVSATVVLISDGDYAAVWERVVPVPPGRPRVPFVIIMPLPIGRLEWSKRTPRGGAGTEPGDIHQVEPAELHPRTSAQLSGGRCSPATGMPPPFRTKPPSKPTSRTEFGFDEGSWR